MATPATTQREALMTGVFPREDFDAAEAEIRPPAFTDEALAIRFAE